MRHFEVYVSQDGDRWERYPEGDSNAYYRATQEARSRSKLLERYERVVNTQMGVQAVTYFNGRAIPDWAKNK